MAGSLGVRAVKVYVVRKEGRMWVYRGEDGATAIEYSLIGTLVAVVCIIAFQRFASVTGVLYTVIGGLVTYL